MSKCPVQHRSVELSNRQNNKEPIPAKVNSNVNDGNK